MRVHAPISLRVLSAAAGSGTRSALGLGSAFIGLALAGLSCLLPFVLLLLAALEAHNRPVPPN